jgi:arylsulfatase A-like enzyme
VRRPLLATVLLAAACTEAEAPVEAGPPNLLLVVADDLGVNDLGRSNPDLRTPELDRFAEASVRLSNFYSAADTCEPARAAILTGIHPERVLQGRGIPREVETLPERLRAAGYRTQHVGKWHLGESPAAVRPLGQGYAGFFGFWSQYRLQPPRDDGRPRAPRYTDPLLVEADGAPQPYRGHLTDLLAEAAERWIRAAAAEQPWFLSVWFLAPHVPLEPPERFAARHPDTPAGRYAAQLESLDDAFGRLLAALAASGQMERTVVIFTSDNAGSGRAAPSNHPYRGRKNELFEGGLRVPAFVRWPGRLAPRDETALAWALDWAPTLEAFAGLAPDPSREGIDLGPLLRGDPTAAGASERTLYWSAPVFHAHGMDDGIARDLAVLRAREPEERWRYLEQDGAAELQDLVADRSGSANALEREPLRARELRAAWLAWHEALREIPVRRSLHGAVAPDSGGLRFGPGAGTLELSGWDVQRTPGDRGWGFATALAPAGPGNAARFVAGQAEAWSLAIEPDGTLVAELAGAHLSAPGPLPGRCAPVALFAWFDEPLLPSKPRSAWIDLHVDGRLAARASVPGRVPDSALDRPTRVGSASSGPSPFAGWMAEPRVLRFRLAPEEAASVAPACPGATPINQAERGADRAGTSSGEPRGKAWPASR